MGQPPSTFTQLGLILLTLLPGVTYQFLRQRWRGAVPGEQKVPELVLRAVTASLLLDALYLVVAGPHLVDVVRGPDSAGWDGILESPRSAGIWALVLFMTVPAIAAGCVSWWQRRRLDAEYRDIPTAWDQLFRDRGPCFVRVRFTDGSWAGGWYGARSYATSYPFAPQLYLQSAWLLNQDGSFLRKVTDSAGIFLRCDDIQALELIHPPKNTPRKEPDT